MQALTTANGGYSLAALTAALQGGELAISPRFEVLDSTLTRLGDLATVTAASVNWNVDRAVKGSLSLTMLADTTGLLPFASTLPFTRYVKPWFRALMPDGGYAEWPQGVYLWTRPQRSVSATGIEQWSMTAGDRGHVLMAGGPGPAGFSLTAGTRTTDAMGRVLVAALGSSVDTSRVVASTSTIASALTWDMTQNAAQGLTTASTGGKQGANGTSGQPGTTWADILSALSGALGYYSCWFDLVGRPVLMPVPALSSAAAGVTYSSGAASLLLPPVTDEQLFDSLANRVIVRPQNTSTGAPMAVGSADLNTLIPGHPFSQAVIGFYIDAVIDDTVASTTADLNARATAELYLRAAMYQKVGITTQAWPVHEAFDVVGVQWTGDADFATQKLLHEREWTLDLFTGATTRALRRIVP